MSLTWEEKVTELIEHFCDEGIELRILKEDQEYVVNGVKGTDTEQARDQDLVCALMRLDGVNPTIEDRRDYDPGDD